MKYRTAPLRGIGQLRKDGNKERLEQADRQYAEYLKVVEEVNVKKQHLKNNLHELDRVSKQTLVAEIKQLTERIERLESELKQL